MALGAPQVAGIAPLAAQVKEVALAHVGDALRTQQHRKPAAIVAALKLTHRRRGSAARAEGCGVDTEQVHAGRRGPEHWAAGAGGVAGVGHKDVRAHSRAPAEFHSWVCLRTVRRRFAPAQEQSESGEGFAWHHAV